VITGSSEQQASVQKTIQLAQRAAFLSKAVAQSVFLSEEPHQQGAIGEMSSGEESAGRAFIGLPPHGDGHASQSAHLDPGVTVGGLGGRVAKHVGDCFKRLPGGQQLSRQRMAKQVEATAPGRLARPTRRRASRMIVARLFSAATGSNGAQWRRKTVRFVDTGRPSSK
jgi:hypothetical protein